MPLPSSPNVCKYRLFGARGKDQFIAMAASSTPQIAIKTLTIPITQILKRAERNMSLKIAVKKWAITRKMKMILASLVSYSAVFGCPSPSV